jgi:hypothetical protein
MISKYKNSSCRIVEFHYEKKKKVENFLITDTNCFICSEPYTKKAMMKHFKVEDYQLKKMGYFP